MTKRARLVAGVDVGGTNIEVGVVAPDHSVVARAKAPTPTDGPDAVLSTIADLVSSLDEDPVALGVGIPGVVHRGEVLTVPNLSHWTERVEIGDELGRRLRLPVSLGNDANVGLLGEHVAGAARGADGALGVWMGTGIGGALVIGGQLYGGSRGAAGEIGHVVVQERGALCGCGRRGCVEAYAGRRQMEVTATALQAAGRTTRLFAIRDELGKASVTSKVWKKALEDEDPVATELFSTAIDALGVAIGSTLNVLDVPLVVLGGGLVEKLGQDLADRVATATAPWVLQEDPDRRFVASALGDDAGIVGAAALAREQSA
ncbi:ROK family protein [Williamsia deligens]|uniref:ROK family protein n=1 Tax=Williamsia deligens TaxID=321325 RepID=A0ABW3G7I7_9NOCA|nr:ROK family protein [Williamsia deligens]